MFTKVDDELYEFLNQYTWSYYKGPRTGYAVAHIGGKQVRMHRFIVNPPKDKVTDHIDGDGLNNQRSNLRACSVSENRRNSANTNKINRTSVFKGVSYVKRERVWRAFIYPNRIQIYLGRFKTELEAAKAYDSAAEHYFKEFAYLNFKKSS